MSYSLHKGNCPDETAPTARPFAFLFFAASCTGCVESSPMESPSDHQLLPFLRAIGIPATATYEGKLHRAYVFIWGREKATGVGYPFIEVYLKEAEALIPEKELWQFKGPDLSRAALTTNTFEVSITRGEEKLFAVNRVGFCPGPYPASIVPDGGNDVFDTGINQNAAQIANWKQFIRKMNSGFDTGHITIGGVFCVRRSKWISPAMVLRPCCRI